MKKNVSNQGNTGILQSDSIAVWPNFSRAVEIAILGNYSISVYYKSDYKSGAEDYQFIKEKLKGVFENFSPNGDITVSIYAPKFPLRTVETLQDILNRVQNYPTRPPKLELDPSSEALLLTAQNRLGLGILKVDNVQRLAVTIAQMDRASVTRCEHIAEAIQYNIGVSDEYLINAEANSITFGNGITISKGKLYSEDVTAAIDHLQGLLKG